MEIERQFLVDIIPALPDTFDSILQGYVSLFPEIRIRSVRPSEGPEKFYLTVKRGETLSAIVRKFDCDLGGLAKARRAPKRWCSPRTPPRRSTCARTRSASTSAWARATRW